MLCIHVEPNADVQPTWGLNLKSITLSRASQGDKPCVAKQPEDNGDRTDADCYSMRLVDLGGGASIRGYWTNYYAEVLRSTVSQFLRGLMAHFVCISCMLCVTIKAAS